MYITYIYIYNIYINQANVSKFVFSFLVFSTIITLIFGMQIYKKMQLYTTWFFEGLDQENCGVESYKE